MRAVAAHISFGALLAFTAVSAVCAAEPNSRASLRAAVEDLRNSFANRYPKGDEFLRRMDFGIYDSDEFKRATSWVKENCKEGREYNAPDRQRTRAQKDQDWEKVVKMAMIARDLMNGNPRLAELGFP